MPANDKDKMTMTMTMTTIDDDACAECITCRITSHHNITPSLMKKDEDTMATTPKSKEA